MSRAAAKKPTKSVREHESDDFPELADDPVWQAVLNAPVVEETDEEHVAAEEAMRGPFIPGHVVSAEIAARCRRGE
jgi:hypothetical protein